MIEAIDIFAPDKLCRRCKRTKPLDGFSRNKRAKDGLQTYCKVCTNALTMERYRRDPAPYAARNAAYQKRVGRPYAQAQKRASRRYRAKPDTKLRDRERWLRRYGITLDDYTSMHQKQGGCCAVCGVSEIEHGKPLVVDHEHTTGRVRGLLCHKCNIGLGLFGDDIFRLQRAINYLL
jgi:hypothetical protein